MVDVTAALPSPADHLSDSLRGDPEVPRDIQDGQRTILAEQLDHPSDETLLTAEMLIAGPAAHRVKAPGGVTAV